MTTSSRFQFGRRPWRDSSTAAQLRRRVALVLLTLLAIISSRLAVADAPLLRNGEFREWLEGEPVQWDIFEGASSGKGEASVVSRSPSGGLMLQGNAQTRVWRGASQEFSVVPRGSYRCSFQARAAGVRKEPGQFNSCYVGIAFFDQQQRRLGLHVIDVSQTDWSQESLTAMAPPSSQSGKVLIFLAKTGRLEVRSVSVQIRGPEQSFEILVEDMDRYYSYFDHRRIDWDALVGQYKDRVTKAHEPDAFITGIRTMLAHLQDPHVWIEGPDGRRYGTYSREVPTNYDYDAAWSRLVRIQRIGQIGIVGWTPEGLPYVAVTSLQGEPRLFDELERAMEGLLDAPGLLLDLRANTGGNERYAQQIAAIFADTRRVYAKSKVRAGPGHADFVHQADRIIEPRQGRTFVKPIVCLIGPRCMSSGEGFVKMMDVMPHVTLVGQSTRGASGNPAAVSLPNGVRVYYSRWVDMLPDGTVIEAKGIPADLRVEHRGAGDPTFDAAVAELKRQLQN